MNGGVKKAVNFLKSWEFFGLVASGLIGGLVFFIFFGDTLWPQNISWILADGTDTFQHQIGWEFFRNSAWGWPWGVIQNLNYPSGISLLYTDSFPLLAIFFKLWRNLLPTNFQYLGMWMFLSFVLQGLCGFLLMRLIKKDTLLDILGSIFFIFNPIVFQRVAGHASLVSHFLILAALYLCLNRSSVWRAGFWGIILILSLFTHPYLFFMIVPFWLSEQIRLYKLISKIKWWGGNLATIAILGLLSFVVGMWGAGEGGAEGFGEFSLNLNGLFNPLGWSKIMPEWPIQTFQYEGFNYLGLGILFLGLLSGYFFIFKQRKIFVSLLKKYWPLLIVAVFLTAVALSNKIYFNNHLVFSYPLPSLAEKCLSIVRSSGRMFWPVYYLLVLASLFFLRFLKRKWALILICLTLVLQLTDLSKGLLGQHINYTDRVMSFPSQDSFWAEYARWNYVFKNYKHIVILPYFERFDLPMSLTVARSGQTFTAGAFARKPSGLKYFLDEEIKKVCSGNFDKDTAYLFFDNLYKCLPKEDVSLNKYTFKQVLNFWVVLPH